MLRDASLMLLKEGNVRFVSGKMQHPNTEAERRTSTASEQEPFASILACSDSRGPVELIFDRGVGDLFVVRVAGNVAGDTELASLEYGVEHLNTPILVVLGHSKCGAVTAVTKAAELHGHLGAIAEKIQPAADKARTESTNPNDLIPRAVQANVWNTMERVMRDSSIIRERVEAGNVQVVGAIYDLETGRVSWLGSHPAQDAIVALSNQTQTNALVRNAKGPALNTAAVTSSSAAIPRDLALKPSPSATRAKGAPENGAKLLKSVAVGIPGNSESIPPAPSPHH